MRPGGFEALDVADLAEGHAGRLRIAGDYGVLQAQRDRIDAELRREVVQRAFDREVDLRRAGRAIGLDRRAVGQDLPARDPGIGEAVVAERADQPGMGGVPGIGPGVVDEIDLRADQGAVGRRADPQLDHRAGGRAGGAKHLAPAHRQAHRTASLARQQHGDGLEVDAGLAAETAADLQRMDADVGLGHAEHRGGERADREMPLARRPDLGLPVGVPRGDADVGLDITLVDEFGGIAARGHGRRAGQGRGRVAARQGDLHRHVGGTLGRGLDALGEDAVVKQRRIVAHRCLGIEDMGQDLVVHRDQRQGFLRDAGRSRRHGCHGVAVVENLLVRHAGARDVDDVARAFARADRQRFEVGKVRAGDDRLDPGQSGGLAGVDAADAGMGMGTAQDRPIEHPGDGEVWAEHRLAGDFLDPVRADRAGADMMERPGRDLAGEVVHAANSPSTRRSCRNSAAASSTARTILS